MKKLFLVFIIILCFVFISCNSSVDNNDKLKTESQTSVQEDDNQVQEPEKQIEEPIDIIVNKVEYAVKYYINGELIKEEKYENGISVDLLDISNEYENFDFWSDINNNKINSPLVIDKELELYANFSSQELLIITVHPLQGISYFKLHPLYLGEKLKIDAVFLPTTASSYFYKIVFKFSHYDFIEVVDDCYLKAVEGKEYDYLLNGFTYYLAAQAPWWEEDDFIYTPPYRINNNLEGPLLCFVGYYVDGKSTSFIGKPTLSNEEYSPETGKLVLHDGDKIGLLFYEKLDGQFAEINLDEFAVSPITYEIIEGEGFTIDSDGIVRTNLDSVTDFKIAISRDFSFDVYSYEQESTITQTSKYYITLS